MQAISKTISASILVYYYDKYADEYGGDYPEVKNPAALVQGIDTVVKAIGDGTIADNTLLYVLEDDDDRVNPQGAQYLIMITNANALSDAAGAQGYSVRLFYTKTQELESISSFEENKVVWSPDNMNNTKHPNRTKYYLGMAYMLCDKSPGFDSEPMPELELTGADLIALGVEGELPPEVIEIALPGIEEQQQAEEAAREAAEQAVMEGIWDSEDEEVAESVPEEDDTEVIIESPYAYDNEYDDLETDYEELFE